MSVDLSGMMARFARIRAAGPAARTEALKVATGAVVRELLARVPRKTNRLARGYALANNLAGLQTVSVPLVRNSPSSQAHIKRLERQVRSAAKAVNRWKNYESQYIRERRTRQPYFRKILAQLDPDRRSSAAWRLRRSIEELEKYTSAAKLGLGPLLVQNKGRGLGLTTRDKIYGGSGQTVTFADVSLVKITNLEPHAIIQERARRTVASVLKMARPFGVQRAKRVYAERLKLA